MPVPECFPIRLLPLCRRILHLERPRADCHRSVEELSKRNCCSCIASTTDNAAEVDDCRKANGSGDGRVSAINALVSAALPLTMLPNQPIWIPSTLPTIVPKLVIWSSPTAAMPVRPPEMRAEVSLSLPLTTDPPRPVKRIPDPSDSMVPKFLTSTVLNLMAFPAPKMRAEVSVKLPLTTAPDPRRLLIPVTLPVTVPKLVTFSAPTA